jgi:hypothetical protein
VGDFTHAPDFFMGRQVQKNGGSLRFTSQV